MKFTAAYRRLLYEALSALPGLSFWVSLYFALFTHRLDVAIYLALIAIYFDSPDEKEQ